jgi:hypothetical protein
MRELVASEINREKYSFVTLLNLSVPTRSPVGQPPAGRSAVRCNAGLDGGPLTTSRPSATRPFSGGRLRPAAATALCPAPTAEVQPSAAAFVFRR